MEEGMKCGETDVAGGRGVVPVVTQMMQEGDHFLRSQIVEIEICHGPRRASGDEAQEEYEAIAVAVDSMSAHASQAWKMIREEVAEGARQCIWDVLHRVSPRASGARATRDPYRRAKRSLAQLASSSTKCR